MRAIVAASLLAAVLVAHATVAAGDERPLTHRHQVGVAVSAGSGYRIAFRYDSAYACGGPDGPDAGKTACYVRIPTWLDLKLFFGVSRSVDLLVEQRIGLENDFYGARPLVLMPGLRWFPEPDHMVKLFLQVQLAFEFSNPVLAPGAALERYDFGVREMNGLQFDFLPWLGAYLELGPTFLFVRSLDFQLEAGAGVEGRFP